MNFLGVNACMHFPLFGLFRVEKHKLEEKSPKELSDIFFVGHSDPMYLVIYDVNNPTNYVTAQKNECGEYKINTGH